DKFCHKQKMAVVIRLQGLPVVAGSSDIRHFFSGLHIPDGGVHIIGGKFAEAFIIFATDEDARRAMSRSGGFIKKSAIQLFLSSKTEMQHTLEMSRKGSKDPKHDSRLSGPAPDTSSQLGAVKKGMHQKSMGDKTNAESGFEGRGAKHFESNVPRQKFQGREIRPLKEDDSEYVYLFGLPYSASDNDVEAFFHGLNVMDILFTHQNGRKDGNAYVKFGSVDDANAALQRNNEYIGHRFISVKKTSEHKWIEAGGHVEPRPAHVYRERSPRFNNMYNASAKNFNSRQQARSRSPHNQEFYIHLLNLSYAVEKRDIKEFLGEPQMPDSQIKFLHDRHGVRTRECFIVLKNERQYQKCLSLHKGMINSREVWLYPSTLEEMLQFMDSAERQSLLQKNNTEGSSPKRRERDHPNTKRCIYLRNFPFDVSKPEVQKFFDGFTVNEHDIDLLYDGKGVGLGEALVTFPSEQQAILAESLNRQRFLGTEVLLRRISEEQMRELGAFHDNGNKRENRNSPGYRHEYLEPVRSHPEQSFGFADYGHGSYEPRQSFGFSDDFGQGSGELRRSPERVQSQYNMNIGRHDEPYGKFEMRNRGVAEYDCGPKQRPKRPAIHLKNVPYTATVEEILDFFYGYNVVPDSVQIDYNNDGSPRGTAVVQIENYDEAVAAVNELNDRPIGPRKVRLVLIGS
ncbi:hypothetical protein GDO86_010851, partial [Hymenochirus boettgeri]